MPTDLSQVKPYIKGGFDTILKKKTFVIFLALASGFHTVGLYVLITFLPSFLSESPEIDLATAYRLGCAIGDLVGERYFFRCGDPSRQIEPLKIALATIWVRFDSRSLSYFSPIS